MEFDNQTMFRHSHVSSKCFYTARVAEHLEQSVVNLCDRNGGLFGTLALVEGAFVIEPLVDIEQEQEGEMVNGRSGEQLHNVGVRKRKRHLTAEFASDLRAHHVYRLQPHHFDDFRKRTATAAEAEEAKLGTEHHQQRSTSTLNDDHQGFRSAKSVPPWPNRLPLLTTDADHKDGTSVPHQQLQQRPTRSANSWEHFVEVLVVADYKMLLYHQHNLENYVLTLFSTVSYIYRHSSLGAAIKFKLFLFPFFDVIVVRLVVLKNERAGPDVSNRAQETLQQFCQWQHTLNDGNDDALNHHDVAILLTRHDICRAPNKCDTLGLAELGTMCDGRKSCAIIEDNGLSAAFTIAHELGHVFNIPHDDD
uniref:Peptidase M12B domain-containing protein n=1 Tax=Globodera pallida TaxID=36090 RepID=A0A183CQS2_GLOPA